MEDSVESTGGGGGDPDCSRKEKVGRLETLAAGILKSKANKSPPTASTVFKNCKWNLEEGIDDTRRGAWKRISGSRSSQWRGADCDIVAGLLKDGQLVPAGNLAGGEEGEMEGEYTIVVDKEQRQYPRLSDYDVSPVTAPTTTARATRKRAATVTSIDEQEKVAKAAEGRPKRRTSGNANYVVRLEISSDESDTNTNTNTKSKAPTTNSTRTTKKKKGSGKEREKDDKSTLLADIKSDFASAVRESAAETIGRIKAELLGSCEGGRIPKPLSKEIGRFKEDMETVIGIVERNAEQDGE